MREGVFGERGITLSKTFLFPPAGSRISRRNLVAKKREAMGEDIDIDNMNLTANGLRLKMILLNFLQYRINFRENT